MNEPSVDTILQRQARAIERWRTREYISTMNRLQREWQELELEWRNRYLDPGNWTDSAMRAHITEWAVDLTFQRAMELTSLFTHIQRELNDVEHTAQLRLQDALNDYTDATEDEDTCTPHPST